MRKNQKIIAASYRSILDEAFTSAKKLVTTNQVDAELKKIDPEMKNAITTIVGNLDLCKYLFSILLTALVTKAVFPKQDIRRHQSRMEGGYSNRGSDQRFVTPFLKEKKLTACAASGAESGRNFERPIPYTLDFPGYPKGKGNKISFLKILHNVEEKKQDPKILITLLLALDIGRVNKPSYDYPEPQDLPIKNMIEALLKHFTNSKGHNKSRLPVLAFYSIYKSLIAQLERFKDMTLLPLEYHTTADFRSKKIGDIQVDRVDGTAFEGVEIKSGLSFKEFDILDLSEKFLGQPVNRYYLLTTAKKSIANGHENQVEEAIKTIRNETGCQIIVNGIIPSLKYYLRLLTDTNTFIRDYTKLVESDDSVPTAHKKAWSEILHELQSNSEEKKQVSKNKNDLLKFS